MTSTPNVFTYVAYCNPQAVYDVLTKAGYSNMPKDRAYLAKALADYVSHNQEKALMEMMLIHPDREAIIEAVSMAEKPEKKITGIPEGNGDFMNCNGNCAQCMMKQADGDTGTVVSEKTINMLIIGGSVVLGSVLLTLIIVNTMKS